MLAKRSIVPMELLYTAGQQEHKLPGRAGERDLPVRSQDPDVLSDDPTLKGHPGLDPEYQDVRVVSGSRVYCGIDRRDAHHARTTQNPAAENIDILEDGTILDSFKDCPRWISGIHPQP